MFTLEESALLRRMLRFVGWVLLALVGPINPVAWGGGPNLSEYLQ